MKASYKIANGLAWALCVFIAAVFLLSLTTWVQAMTSVLWMLTIVTTECSALFALGTLGLLVVSARVLSGRKRLFSAVTLTLTLVSFTYPLASAGAVARKHHLTFSPFKQLSSGSLAAGFAQERSPNRGQAMAYAKDDQGRDVMFDFYPGICPSRCPLVIVIHGGSWRNGDRGQFAAFNSILARRGYSVAAIDYRMVPAAKFPAPVVDALAAVGFFQKNAAIFAIDPKRIALLGRSAGGQIALSAAYSSPHIRAVVGIYSPADLVWGYEITKAWHIINGKIVIGDYLGGSPAELPVIYRGASPVHHVAPTSPPTLLIHGERDELVGFEHTRRLVAALEGKKARFELLDLPWATHGFDYFMDGPGGQLAAAMIMRFLERNL